MDDNWIVMINDKSLMGVLVSFKKTFSTTIKPDTNAWMKYMARIHFSLRLPYNLPVSTTLMPCSKHRIKARNLTIHSRYWQRYFHRVIVVYPDTQIRFVRNSLICFLHSFLSFSFERVSGNALWVNCNFELKYFFCNRVHSEMERSVVLIWRSCPS